MNKFSGISDFFQRKLTGFLFILIIFLALIIRLPNLGSRTMHGDEAVNAFKFSELLEKGSYVYDPQEYHGPALYYLTLPFSWLFRQHNLQELTATGLRLEPVALFLLLICSLWIVRRELGRHTILLAGTLMALSPAMIYYSRYYIHEMTFIAFLYHAVFWVFRYMQGKKFRHIILSGIFWGLCLSTKETWIIAAFSWFIAMVCVWFIQKKLQSTGSSSNSERFPARKAGLILLLHWAVAVMVIMLVIIIFYSSFFTDWQGIRGMFSAYTYYFDRAVESSLHQNPWHFYIERLTYFQIEGGLIWSEGIIFFLSILSLIIFRRKSDKGVNKIFIGYLIIFTLSLLLVLSIIPYKTPWNLLAFWPGLIILAAASIQHILKMIRIFPVRVLFLSFLFISVAHLIWQSYQLNTRYSESPQNPYVYAHPTRDVVHLADKILKIAKAQAPESEFIIRISDPKNDYWPLPWYLRSLDRVSWTAEMDTGINKAGAIVVKCDQTDQLLHYLYEVPPPGYRNLYVPVCDSTCYLRPGVELCGYVRKDAWDRLR